MTDPASGDFYVQYAAALTAFLESKAEASLAVGHELGRRLKSLADAEYINPAHVGHP